MDLDAYSAAHSDEWDDLARVTRQRRLSGADADRLIDRYQSGASDLSAIRTTAGASIIGDRLSITLSRARLRFTGVRTNVLAGLPRFFLLQLPAALYRVRWLTLVVAVGSAAIAVLWGFWLSSNPTALLQYGTDAQLREYANQRFVGYYSAHPSPAFAGQVWTNNAWIATQSVAFGITGAWPVYVAVGNAMNVGMAGAIMARYHHLDHFFLYIAPHGQLELYSIFVAVATGLMIAWAWIAPGPRTRAVALADAGRSLFTIVAGLMIMLAMSGFIEGFITRQEWPWPVKIGLGTIALLLVLAYQWVLGRRAARAGETGDLDEFEAGARQLTAA